MSLRTVTKTACQYSSRNIGPSQISEKYQTDLIFWMEEFMSIEFNQEIIDELTALFVFTIQFPDLAIDISHFEWSTNNNILVYQNFDYEISEKGKVFLELINQLEKVAV